MRVPVLKIEQLSPRQREVHDRIIGRRGKVGLVKGFSKRLPKSSLSVSGKLLRGVVQDFRFVMNHF